MPQCPVRGHHLQRAHVVGGVAEGAAEGRAETAAQGVTGDSHRGARPVQRSQPVLDRLRDDLGPYRSGADPRRAADRVMVTSFIRRVAIRTAPCAGPTIWWPVVFTRTGRCCPAANETAAWTSAAFSVTTITAGTSS